MDVGQGSGAVKVDQVVLPAYPFTLNLDDGAVVTLKAVPAFGYRFDGWSDDVSHSDNPATIRIDCDKSVTANFSVNWLLIAGSTSGIVLIGLLTVVLIVRRRARLHHQSYP